MINPSQIKQKAERLYPIFLRAIIRDEPFRPLEFPVGKPPDDYLALREAVTQLINESKQKLGYGYTIELETRKTRKFGDQSIPQRIRIDTEVDYLKLIKKQKEFLKFRADVELIRVEVAALENWLFQNPLKVIEYAGYWIDLIKVCHYFQANPRPNVYIRELPIKIHTKFIEENQGIIRNLLEAILPAEAIQPVEREKEYIFEKRFSLRYKEPLVRLRVLDKALQAKYCFPAADFSTPIYEFMQLNLKEHSFIITENLINFLTLPALENSFGLFVGGYAIQVVKYVNWLLHCPIFYWGDLDADGFKILSQFRYYFPHTISVMMDEETFRTFEEFSVTIAASNAESLLYLTKEEHFLFSYLSEYKKRLEQEHISQYFANRYLQNALQQNDQ
ncbi:DUF3322 domain-containing protein [Nostoc sp. MG11]|uniref:DUF3322 domain-containing protein n=1 Tax=Nostoc sp. MG11 TaxID=2721166 RepID=UPI00186631EB|nr:DUF3322 domain-containing protein [Nostoc sp. MG11]